MCKGDEMARSIEERGIIAVNNFYAKTCLHAARFIRHIYLEQKGKIAITAKITQRLAMILIEAGTDLLT